MRNKWAVMIGSCVKIYVYDRATAIKKIVQWLEHHWEGVPGLYVTDAATLYVLTPFFQKQDY